MKVYIGADHRGFALKEQLKPWLTAQGHEVTDCGNTTLDANDDYPDFAFAVADAVVSQSEISLRETKDASSRAGLERGAAGIVICGSGAGVTIAANKVPGIRAVTAFTADEITRNRQHDDVNVLSLAADWTDEEQAKKIVAAFLSTAFYNEEKYVRRLKKIKDRETVRQ